jgi:hypothetical protein
VKEGAAGFAVAGLAVIAAEAEVRLIGPQGDAHINLENVTDMQGCMTVLDNVFD